MFVALGVGSVTAAMFHLFTHAFFKSLLFLGAGSVIHATEQQVVESLGGLWRKMPATTILFALGSLRWPGSSRWPGSGRRTRILLVLRDGAEFGPFVLLAATAALTAIYTTRLVLLTFFGQPKDQHAYDHAHESPLVMVLPMALLCLLAVIAGFIALDPVGRVLGFTGGVGEVVFTQGHEGHAFSLDATVALGATLSALAGIANRVHVLVGRSGARRSRTAVGAGVPRPAGQPLLHRPPVPVHHRQGGVRTRHGGGVLRPLGGERDGCRRERAGHQLRGLPAQVLADRPHSKLRAGDGIGVVVLALVAVGRT